MTAADHYLTITPHPHNAIPTLRWSANGDAVETDDGRTVALHEEVKAVLEGVFSTDARPPFVWVLDLLDWCRRPDAPPLDRPADRVWVRLRPLVVAAKPTGRNLGRLVAFLCEGLPPALVVPDWKELSETLELRRMFGTRSTAHPLPSPPLSRTEVATRVNSRLGSVTQRQLVGLLSTGEPELPDPEPVAQALRAFPERLAAVLAEFRSRDRLVGAAFLAPTIDGALALPPRRPTPDRLPQGGYADVTTRGIPDRLLPSQFALDADEFVRRFAENELLYFRREEPHAALRPTRVLLLDQGVRTWGPVRLGLAGAAVAVLTRDPARFAAVSVGLTSRDDFLDPWAISPAELASRLEASDLSPNPADLLERALSQAADGPRDIVLLTHPRNARELAVREPLTDLSPDDRLFFLTLDDAGEAELLEADERGQRRIRRFRVDLAGAEAVKVAAKPTLSLPSWSSKPWTGDIEPVPFPFRAGLVADVDQRITFDADANWVVVMGRDGSLHAKRVNSDAPLEVLPRPLWQGKLLGPVRALLPLRDGFAVVACSGDCESVDRVRGVGPPLLIEARRRVGRARDREVRGVDSPLLISARYDFAGRVVKCLRLGLTPQYVEFLSLPETDCVMARSRPYLNNDACDAFRFVTDVPSQIVDRGWNLRAMSALASPVDVNISEYPGTPSLSKRPNGLALTLLADTSTTLTATSEGKSIFQNATLMRAVLAADTLAVVAAEGRSSNLWLLNVKDGAVLHQQGNVTPSHALTLSPDGRWLARQNPAGRTVEVRAVNGGSVDRLANGGYHNSMGFDLATDCLHVKVGRYTHRFWLGRVPFACESGGDRGLGQRVLAADSKSALTAYDAKRFEVLVEAGPWLAAFDRWGQVVLMDRVGTLVLHVCVCRGQWAVTLPDGTRCGSAALLGGAPTPDAERLIGEALRSAAEGVGGESCKFRCD